MYSIGKLISETIRRKGLKRSAVVKALGYKNINKALRKLDQYIRGEGECSKNYLYALSQILEIDKETTDEAIRATENEIISQKEEAARRREVYERKHFRPYMYIKTSKTKPSSITMVAFVGVNTFKHIDCPDDILSLPIEEQTDTVRKIIKQHYTETKGKSIMFGDITGYIYRKTYDDNIEFSIDGEIIGISMGKFDEGPKPTLQIGNKVIIGGLLNIKPTGVELNE